MLKALFRILSIVNLITAFGRGRGGRYLARRAGHRAVRRIFR